MADYSKETVKRVSSLRLRTLSLTLSIIIALVFYFIISISLRTKIDWVTFGFLAVIQILVHCLYFPDGDLFGQKDGIFIANKKAYNDRALSVNENKKFARLREFCKYEYEMRKKVYIDNECSAIGITLEELEILKQKQPNEILNLQKWEIDGKLIIFNKKRVKRLYNLIYNDLPIEYNHAETIMSAIENDGSKAIHDTSNNYRTLQYIMKFLKATVIGLIFAYIGYTIRDGFGLNEIAQICFYLTALFSTAVMSFTSGEKTSKIYKNAFYVQLVNFLDEFSEWDGKSVE